MLFEAPGFGPGAPPRIATALRVEELGAIGSIVFEARVEANSNLRTDDGVVNVADHAALKGRPGGFRSRRRFLALSRLAGLRRLRIRLRLSHRRGCPARTGHHGGPPSLPSKKHLPAARRPVPAALSSDSSPSAARSALLAKRQQKLGSAFSWFVSLQSLCSPDLCSAMQAMSQPPRTAAEPGFRLASGLLNLLPPRLAY